MERHICCLDMDCYFVSVERLLDAKLKNQPVIVGGDPHSRGVVSACSYETRNYGIHSGMPLVQAYQRCRQAVFVHPHFTEYVRYSRKILDILMKYVPVIEQASIDEFYLDFTGCDRLYGNIFNFVYKLKQHMEKRLGLPLAIGMGTNKHIAKVASNLAKPGGVLTVHHGQEQSFLAPLPIQYIQGVGPQTKAFLLKRGICKIGQLAQLSLPDTQLFLGKWGAALWLKANGHGSSHCHATAHRKSLSAERTFKKDTADKTVLHQILSQLSERIGYQLRKGK